MNWRIIRAIALKDWKEVRQNKMAWAPMLVIPLIFCVVLPLILLLLPRALNTPPDKIIDNSDIELFLRAIPPILKAQIAGLNDYQVMTLLLLGYMLAPLFLILPLMTSSVIGSDSFVGEKERKTMEALLYTPATEHELFFAKMLSAVLPAVLLSWGSFVVYTIILNVVGGDIMGRIWFPTPPWWPLVLWVTPAVAVAGMTGAVVISARVNTFMEAYQSTGLLVLPLILLVVGQMSGVLFLGVEVTFIVGLVIWLIDAVLLWFALRLFSRLSLLGTAAQNQS